MNDSRNVFDRYSEMISGTKRGRQPKSSEERDPRNKELLDRLSSNEEEKRKAALSGEAPAEQDGADAAAPAESAAEAKPLPEETVEDVLADLNKLVGLSEIKSQVESLSNLIEIQKKRKAQGLPTVEVGRHLILSGNPGTGKTTVARIIGRLYKALGVLAKGHTVEVDRGSLVGGYVGQTAIKTGEVLDQAEGGVLFIDEAYSLVDGGESDFGKEAIATLLKRMEDKRLEFTVIAAGYPNEMKRFSESNPGLLSRFNQHIEFPDYSGEEMLAILKSISAASEYTFTSQALKQALSDFEFFAASKSKNFSNGRLVRNYFEASVQKHADRLSRRKGDLSKKQLSSLTVKDLPERESLKN